MVYIHSVRIRNLKVSWTYHDNGTVENVIFVDESKLPFRRQVVTPRNPDLRYSTVDSALEFARSLYNAYYLQQSLETNCLTH